jgi:general secretion pathway protein L
MQIAVLTTLRQRYGETGIPRFLSWWYSELTSLLPERVRAQVRTGPRRLFVVPDSEGLGLWFSDEGTRHHLGELELEADPAVAQQQLRGLLERLGGDEPDMVLVLPADNVLRHVVSLPEAAAENMREVLTFEMDRHTPFSASDVYFDFRVVGRHPATGKLDVEMATLPSSSRPCAACAWPVWMFWTGWRTKGRHCAA